MNIFINKEIKKLLILIAVLLLCFLAGGQFIIRMISNDFKEELLIHDYKVAGYLSGKADTYDITGAFTAENYSTDFEKGKEILVVAGYETSAENELFPEISSLQSKYSLFAALVWGLFALALVAVLLYFNVRNDRKLAEASDIIEKFMYGDTNLRLSGNYEGSLSKLFSAVNMLATSLTTHIYKEKQNREFLKDTVSDISHQLKTPLAALKMYNEIILDEKCGSEVVERFTTRSRDELDRMESLIQNLLKLARLDAGAISLDFGNYSVKDFFEKVIKRFSAISKTGNIDVLLDCQKDIIISCDEEWLMEAVGNIVKNALEHSGENGIIKICCTETPLVTKIDIIDNGWGIHPEDINNIFRRFYRSRFSKDKQGVGIGLTISRAIIEKHGGSVVAESELGKGTIFHIVFPKLNNL